MGKHIYKTCLFKPLNYKCTMPDSDSSSSSSSKEEVKKKKKTKKAAKSKKEAEDRKRSHSGVDDQVGTSPSKKHKQSEDVDSPSKAALLNGAKETPVAEAKTNGTQEVNGNVSRKPPPVNAPAAVTTPAV